METKTTYSAQVIAKWFLNHVRQLNSDEDEEYLSNLKLQKLLYYAQGTSLALNDRPLFNEEIVHWQHGPVVKEVYFTYQSYKGNPIIFDEDFNEKIDKEDEELLNTVYETFGCYSAWGLRNMTHNEDPWKNTAMNEVITQESISRYFKDHYVE